MQDKKLLKLLMTIRAALIMAARAIELYCKEDAVIQPIHETDSITGE
jgi:hypothetical protein